MFKKSKRSQIRQRARNHSDSEDEGNEKDNANKQQQHNPAGNSKQEAHRVNLAINESSQSNDSSRDGIRSAELASASAITKKTAQLSFHHEEDEDAQDVFKVKKSVYSKRMERNKKKVFKNTSKPPPSVAQTNGSSSSVSPSKPDPKSPPDEPSAVVVNQDEPNGNDTVICPGSDEDEDDIQFVPKKRPISTSQVHQFRNVVERGTIPDAKVIYELKKQRQKLARTMNEDFIAVNSDEEETLRQEARLQRDNGEQTEEKSDGDDEDDEDEEDRIHFGKVDYKTKEREKAKEAFRMAQEDMEELELQKRKEHASSDESSGYSDDEDGQGGRKQSDDSEDELDRWEREQIRKAVCLPSLQSFNETEFQNRFLQNEKKSSIATSKVVGGHNTNSSNDNHNVIPIEIDDEDDSTQKRFGSHIPPYISSTSRAAAVIDYESVNNRKSEFRQRLLSSLEGNKQLLDRVEMDARLTKQSMDEFQSRKDSFVEDGQFYSETLEFVQNLCECINDKLELIEKCESDAIELVKQRAVGQIEKLRKAVQEQNAACVQLIINFKVSAAEYASITADHGGSIFDFYDFGGDAEKRGRLWRYEEQMKQYSEQQIRESVSEDEEAEPQVADQMAAIKSRLADVFEDTEDEYATLKGVIGRFDRWKRSRLDTYAESFVGQFVAKFIIYYIRHELALWNLFDTTSSYIDPIQQMDCIRHLILYGAVPESPLEPKAEAKWREADVDLVPAVIDKALLVKLLTLVQHGAWNPLSSRQTTRLVLFLTSILSTCPSLIDSSETLPELFKEITIRIEQTIDDDIFIPQMIPPDFFAKGIKRTHYEGLIVSYVTGFYHRQFWQAVKLLRNVLSLRHLLSDYILKELVLDRLLNRLLLMSISRCAADGEAVLAQVTRIVALLPTDWCHSTNPILAKFADLIQQLADAADRSEEHREKLVSLRLKLVK